MDIVASIVPRAQTLELVEQGLRLFDDVTPLAQPAAVFGATAGEAAVHASDWIFKRHR